MSRPQRKHLGEQLLLEMLGIPAGDPRAADVWALVAEGSLYLRVKCPTDAAGNALVRETTLRVDRRSALGNWYTVAERAWADTGLPWDLLSAYATDAQTDPTGPGMWLGT